MSMLRRQLPRGFTELASTAAGGCCHEGVVPAGIAGPGGGTLPGGIAAGVCAGGGTAGGTWTGGGTTELGGAAARSFTGDGVNVALSKSKPQDRQNRNDPVLELPQFGQNSVANPSPQGVGRKGAV
jgi:hypothetical protein